MAKKTVTISKKKNRTICLVQFTHPGKEPTLTVAEKKAGWKGWNYGHHHRKFMVATGGYVDDGGLLCESDALYFWGEWEPDSKVTHLNVPATGGDYPEWLHEPYLLKDPAGKIIAPAYDAHGRQRLNTDPFVFEWPFHYACCKQDLLHTILERGSVVLFGSTIQQNTPSAYFALDTVFVVDEAIAVSDDTWASLIPTKASDDYAKIMGWDITKSHWASTLYNGATFHRPVETPKGNMYSFVPCKQNLIDNTSFERPVIDAAALNKLGQSLVKRNLITPNLNAYPRKTEMIVLENCYEAWDMVRKMIRTQGFDEGVRFEYKS